MATVRVSAGFRPNKMLLSMREGGVCECARVCVFACVFVCVREGCLEAKKEEHSLRKAGKKKSGNGRTHY